MFSNRFRTLLFKTLDLLPERVGQEIYHQIQKALFKSLDPRIKASTRSYEILFKMLEAQGFSLGDKNIVEIGSGWIPIMPYLLKYRGACNAVHTYDINEHYDNKYIDALNSHFASQKTIIEVDVNHKYHLPSFVHYYPKKDVGEAKLPEDTDLVFSRFVLEHVPPEAIRRMHRHLASLKEGALVLHLISPSDHRAYTDKSLSYYDFLKYSQKEWNGIQTKFDYHNRLRLPQYVALFESAGFEVLDIEYDLPNKDSDKYRAFKKLSIHEDFSHMTEEALLAGAVNVLLRNKKKS